MCVLDLQGKSGQLSGTTPGLEESKAVQDYGPGGKVMEPKSNCRKQPRLKQKMPAFAHSQRTTACSLPCLKSLTDLRLKVLVESGLRI